MVSGHNRTAQLDTGANDMSAGIPPTAESLLQGTGLLSKNQAFKRSGVSWSTFIRALSMNFAGHKPMCGKVRPPALKATHRKTPWGTDIVAVDPKDLREWKRQRGQLQHDGSEKKKKASSPVPKSQ